MASSGRFVFVSHCSADQEEAGRIVAHYEAQGIRMWWGPRDIQPGRDLNQQVGWAVQNCSAMLVVASEACRGSLAVRAEADQAARAGRPIFLVRMADVYLSSDMPALAQARVVIDAFGANAQANVARLTQELQAVLSAASPSPGAPAAPAAGPGWSTPPGGQPHPGGPGAGFGAPARGPIDPEREQLLRAYVRDNADYYLGKWRQMDAGGGRTSFNIAAFFLNALWLVYRKMWGLGLGILGGLLAINAIVLAISPFLSPIISLLAVGIALWVGLMGNSMYRRQAEMEVARAAAASPDPHARMSLLSQRGGTSIGAAIGIGIGAAVLNTIILFTVLAMSGAFDQPEFTGGRTASAGDAATNDAAAATGASEAEAAPASSRELLIGRWGVTCGANDIGLVLNDDGSLRLGGEGAQWEVEGDRININHDNGEFEVLTIRSLSEEELRFTSNADPRVNTVRRCS